MTQDSGGPREIVQRRMVKDYCLFMIQSFEMVQKYVGVSVCAIKVGHQDFFPRRIHVLKLLTFTYKC